MAREDSGKRLVFLVLIVILVVFLVLIYFGYKPIKNAISGNNNPASIKESNCGKIGTDDGRNFCWAQENKSASFCEPISDKDRKNDCYSMVASEKSDYTICDNIKIDVTKWNCYIDIAVARKDENVCSKIGTGALYYLGECYKLVAVEVKDSKVCAGIPNDYYQRECEKAVAVA